MRKAGCPDWQQNVHFPFFVTRRELLCDNYLHGSLPEAVTPSRQAGEKLLIFGSVAVTEPRLCPVFPLSSSVLHVLRICSQSIKAGASVILMLVFSLVREPLSLPFYDYRSCTIPFTMLTSLLMPLRFPRLRRVRGNNAVAALQSLMIHTGQCSVAQDTSHPSGCCTTHPRVGSHRQTYPHVRSPRIK